MIDYRLFMDVCQTTIDKLSHLSTNDQIKCYVRLLGDSTLLALSKAHLISVLFMRHLDIKHLSCSSERQKYSLLLVLSKSAILILIMF